MKRFITSMIISITLITIGFTTLFFEIPSFEIVDVETENEVVTKNYNIDDLMNHNEIDIEVDGSYVHVSISEDYNKTDEIRIEYSKQITLKEKRNKLTFESYGTPSFANFKDMAINFVDGLKEKKIYVNYGYIDSEVIIHCSPENRKYINVDYN